MGARMPSRPPPEAAKTPAAQATTVAESVALDPRGAPSSGYDALSETRKRMAIGALGQQSLFGAGLAPQGSM